VKWRMVAALLGLTLVVLLVHDIPLAKYLRTVENDRIITGLERDAFVIVGNAHDAVEDPNKTNQANLVAVLNNYRASSQAVVIVTNASGTVIASTDPSIEVGAEFKSRPEINKALAGGVATGRRYSNTLKYEILYVAVPMLRGTKVYGSVRITFPASVVDNIVGARLKGIASVAGITLLLAILIALLLATSVTRRLGNLQRVTEQFTDGNHLVRADATAGASEIRSLATSFNLMADQLSTLIAQQRAFAGDASHQLRTPLTALQLRLERATDLLQSDPQAAIERLDAAMVETERLQNIVEGLLVLSKAEEQTKVALEVIDLAVIAKARVENWTALAGESGVVINLDCPDQALILAIPSVAEQVIDNYIDNALKYAPNNSIVTVLVKPDLDTTTLHVIDQGPGLAADDLERAFNRFWRARSDAHGSGLGLAIVDRLLVACGGSARLTNHQPNGLDAQATFNNG
jgi:signal transduction histidine kinase